MVDADRKIEVLALVPLSAADRATIEAVDARVKVTEAGGWFDGEFRETWPEMTVNRHLSPTANGVGSRAERDELLAKAEVILGGWPYPLDLCARSPKLKWFHQRPAGASNLMRGDLWGSDVMATTSRGAGNTLAIAEYTLAAFMHFAKGLPQAEADRIAGSFDHRAYNSKMLAGKSLCVVGVGGIGRDVGRLAAAFGMRVVGVRSQRPKGENLPEGFAEVGGPEDLDAYLAKSEFVAICCHWTPETDRLFDDARFACMQQGAILANVARGEVIDEDALAKALAADRLGGVALDVYVGEFEGLPRNDLWSDARVLVTPHISGASDVQRHRAVEVFRDNLAAYIAGRPLQNVIDWDRGY